MILRIHRAYRPAFAFLWGLLLMGSLLMALPAQAQEGSPGTSRDLTPLPRNCSGLLPGSQTPVCCVSGYVVVDGVPVVGAEVEIRSDVGTLVEYTASGEESTEPYYAVSLSDTLAIEPGEWVTLTVRYDGFTAVRAHQAVAGGQQVDLVINTFEDGDFEGTDLVNDTIRLVRGPTANVKVNDDGETGIRTFPAIAVAPNGQLTTLWTDGRIGPKLRWVFSSQSVDEGLTWSRDLPWVQDDFVFGQYVTSLIVDGNGTLYAAWTELGVSAFGDTPLISYMAKSTNDGLTWSSPVKLGHSDENSIFPTLALDGNGNLYAAWVTDRFGDFEVYVAKSSNEGATWDQSVKVNEQSRDFQLDELTINLRPSLMVGHDGTLYLAWADNRNRDFDMFFATSDNEGQSWSTNVQINDEEQNDQLAPNLAIGEDGVLYTVWQDKRDGYFKAYFAKSTDHGQSWVNQAIDPPADGATQHDLRLQLDSQGQIYVAWREQRNDKSNLLLTRSLDQGQSWRLIGQINTEVDDLVDTPEGMDYSLFDLTIDESDNLYFVWPVEYENTANDMFSARWPDADNFYSEGMYTSGVYDAQEVVGWQTLEWTEELPDGTAITMEVRTGNTPTPGDNWSEWQSFTTWPADLSQLPHGQYLQWQARLSTSVSTNTPSLGPVSLTVQTPAEAPAIQTDPGAIIMRAEEGGASPATQLLQILNGGTGTFAWSATTNTPWLQLDLTSGMVSDTIAVQADSSALSAGSHRGEIILSAPGVPNSPQTIEVVLNVTPPGQSVWTMMFYVAADNDLAFGLKNKELSLQEAAKHANLNILMLIDLADSDDTKLYQVLPDGLLTYAPDNVPWLSSEMDMGDPETLRQFVSWAKEEYPADLTYLNIADHGKGTQGIAWDEQSSSFLPVAELSQALNAATNGEPIDVLHYDACLMAMFEGAYDVRGAADYLVASQNLAWSLFMFRDYANAAAVSDSPSEFASEIARLYHESLTIEEDDYPETISAIDLSKIEQVNERLNELVAVLDPNQHTTALLAARRDTQKFDSRNYYQIDNQDEYLDLYDLALKIQAHITDATVQTRAQALMDSIKEAVIVEHHFSDEAYGHYWDVENAHGISIYYPSAPSIGTETDYQHYLNDKLFAFTQESQYDELLAAVLSGVTPIDAPEDRPPILPLYPLTATQTIEMSPDWHLISIPGERASKEVSEVLDSIAGNHDVAYGYDGCDTSDSWKIYDPNGPSFANNLKEIDRTKGIWVNMTVTDTLVMTSTVPVSSTISLCAGWNLVGYPSAHERPIVEAMESIAGAYTSVSAYDAADTEQPWKKYDPNAPAFVNTLDVMKPQFGYWIHVDQDVTWTIVNQ